MSYNDIILYNVRKVYKVFPLIIENKNSIPVLLWIKKIVCRIKKTDRLIILFKIWINRMTIHKK